MTPIPPASVVEDMLLTYKFYLGIIGVQLHDNATVH